VLKQRHDELPGLVAACAAYMKHESELFDEMARLRSGYEAAHGMAEKIHAANVLGRQMFSLMMKAENYPKLKSSENFLKLSLRLSALETRLADFREAFNEAVNAYNIHIENFPAVLAARPFGFRVMEFLSTPAEERSSPRIKTGSL
jgi:LemA protein